MFSKLGRKPVKKPTAPDELPFPEPLDYLWTWFWELRTGVVSRGMEYPQASWGDVAKWCELTRVILDPWEAKALIRLSLLQAIVASEPKPKKPDAPRPGK